MKKARFRRLASIFLCLTMLFNFMPVISFADASTVLTSTTTNTNKDSGISLTKTATYDPATGKVTTDIEAYTTGTVTQTSVAVPTDIILVLDTSGSMAWNFAGNGNSNERLDAMKTAVSSFIDQTKAQNDTIANAADKHAIAIVRFASARDYDTWSENGTVVASGFTTVDETGAAALTSSVNEFTAKGATAVDYGLNLADQLLEDRQTADGGAYASRNKIVIVFTDGDPTHGSDYDPEVAMDAMNYALAIKDLGAQVFTVGIFNGANVTGEDQSNTFMRYLSSNYPKAYGGTETETYYDRRDNERTRTVYKIYPGAEPHNTGYYLTASNAAALNNVFASISQNIGTPSISLGEEAKLVDIISDYFKLEGVGSADCITVKTADYLGSNTWAAAVAATGVTALVDDDADTVTVSGFDFDENYISETARGTSFYGKKLIISFVTTPNYDAIDAAAAGGAFADGSINTNEHPGSAAILDSNNTDVAHAASPVLLTNTVTYFVDGVQKAKYLRFPGADVTLLAKPADTATHTYSAWATADVTLSGDRFTMPAQNVTLTSVSTPKQFTVTYHYNGTAPSGTTPETAPAQETYYYGDEVTLPIVTVPAGYTFDGWNEDDGDITVKTGTFTMPADNLVFEGSFLANLNSYTVEHYLMNEDGTYPETRSHYYISETDEETGVRVVTGMEVTTNTSAHAHVGYTFDADNPNNKLTGTVLANGALVLKVYYERNPHKVTYVYDNVPTDSAVTPADPSTLNETGVLYGASVTVAAPASAVGYKFTGWTVDGDDVSIDSATGTFIMPDRDVTLHGGFIASEDTKYTVEHYKENVNDDDYTLALTEDDLYGKTGTTAIATPKSGEDFIGFTYNAGISTAEGVILPDGSLVLKLYYDRTEHTVSYSYTNSTVPADATPLPATQTYKYGAEVTVADKATALGYTFNGWNIVGTDITVTDGKFTMPARDVYINGHFDAAPNKYRVEHYMMDENGNYPTTASHGFDVTDSTAITGKTVTAEAVPHTGYTFDADYPENVLSGVVAADGSLVLKLYYARNKVQISYQYDGDAPAGASPTEAGLAAYTKTVYVGQTVTVEAAATAPGYTFSGWTVYTGDASIVDGKIVMPDHDVVLHGSFTAEGDTPYKVEHYFENLNDDNYTLDSSKNQNLTGKTDTTATAVPLSGSDIIGFSYDPTVTAEKGKVSGNIEGDGSLVLRLYYTRTRHSVSYQYNGTVPADASPAKTDLGTLTKTNVKYGTTVTIADNATAAGYTFGGWEATGQSLAVSGGTFTMPAADVIFYGRFNADLTSYTVEHYLMAVDGTYSDTADHSNLYTGVRTGDKVTVVPAPHVGYTYDETKTLEVNAIDDVTVLPDGKLVIKVYYKRNVHNVTYHYVNVPAGVTPTEAEIAGYAHTARYGESVAIKPGASAPGYIFSGWYIHTGDTAIEAGSMTMPDHDVVLHGSFTASGDTKYTVEHYFENLDNDGYTLDSNRTQYLSGKTDTEVTAVPLADIIGCSYDPAVTATLGKASGTIAGDGSLVLRLYYTRARYNVSYQYVGFVPTNANPADPAILNQTSVKYGATVTVAAAASAAGYTFDGWTLTGEDVVVDAGTFKMPARDVILTAHFHRIPSAYSVEHWMEDASGAYTYLAATDLFSVGVNVHDEVKGTPKTYNTYTYNADVTAANNALMSADAVPVPMGTVNEEGTLVLKLYYSRNAYDLTYRFEGNVPAGMTAPAGQTGIKHGHTVDLADITAPAGYVFDGWYYGADKAADPFTMPRENVELVGHFTYADGVKYQVKYYLQNIDDDGYTENVSASYVGYGKTGDYVYAETKTFPGFTYVDGKGVWNGHIKADGTLVLDLYYNRNTYTVSYYHFGTPPADAVVSIDGTPLTLTAPEYLVHRETVRYGAPMTVKSALTADNANYEFRGWNSPNLPGYAAATEIAPGTAYTMPQHNVDFYGAMYDYIVYYDLDGGTLGGSTTADPKHVNWNDADLLPAVEPEKTGMIFSGWTYAADPAFITSTDKYSELAVHTYVTSITLKAKYANSYVVSYEWGHSNVPADVTLPTDSGEYVTGDTYTVDTVYTPGYSVDAHDIYGNVIGTYTFSGWTDPYNGVIDDSNVVIHGKWNYTPAAVTDWNVTYSWTGAPDGEYAQTLPASATVTNGADYTVDTKYQAGTAVQKYDEYGNNVGTWTFSGWDKTGSVTVTSDVQINGSWTYVVPPLQTWEITYTWTNAPDGAYEQTLPASATVVNGAPYTVDTVYTAGMTVDEYDVFGNMLGTWTFSGWDQTGTVPKVENDILITGSWTYESAIIYIPPVIITDGDVILTKVDGADHETVLSNAVFELYADTAGDYDDLVGIYTTDAKGQIRVNDLEGGSYYFLEVRSPEGYLINSEPLTFEITAGGVVRLTWENTKSNIPDVFADDHYAYIIGRDDGLSHPEAEITRAEVATIFFRLLSDETRIRYMTKENPFTDVTADLWCNTAISTMHAMGIIFGRGDGTFDPTGSITRAEFAAIAARFEVNGNTASASFTDIYEHWAQKEINIAANNGWALGYEDGTFRPDEKITRAEAMAMVNRVLQRIPESVDDLLDNMVIWPDNTDTTTWYYLTVQEATNSHYYGRRENGYEYWTELRPVRDWAALEME